MRYGRVVVVFSITILPQRTKYREDNNKEAEGGALLLFYFALPRALSLGARGGRKLKFLQKHGDHCANIHINLEDAVSRDRPN